MKAPRHGGFEQQTLEGQPKPGRATMTAAIVPIARRFALADACAACVVGGGAAETKARKAPIAVSPTVQQSRSRERESV